MGADVQPRIRVGLWQFGERSLLAPANRCPFDIWLRGAPLETVLGAGGPPGRDKAQTGISQGPLTGRDVDRWSEHGLRASLRVRLTRDRQGQRQSDDETLSRSDVSIRIKGTHHYSRTPNLQLIYFASSLSRRRGSSADHRPPEENHRADAIGFALGSFARQGREVESHRRVVT